MDALLTAFLSSGMDGNQNFSTHGHGVNDNISNSYKHIKKRTDEELWFLDNYDINIYSLQQETMSRENFIKFKRDGVKQQLSCRKTSFTEHFTNPITALEIDSSPALNTFSKVPEKCMTFSSYLNHQMHHTLVQKRISPTYFVQPKCYLTLGCAQFGNKLNLYSHCCAGIPRPDVSCMCNTNTSVDFSCDTHELFFHGFCENENACAWIVTFTDAGIDNNVEKDYIGNPTYELSIKNLDVFTDSFEVEFSNIDDNDLFNFEYQISDDCFDELHMLGEDFENEDGTESLVYETSDDEDDFCFQADIVHFDISSSQYLSGGHEAHSKGRKKSKYHVNCCSQPDVKEKNISDKKKHVRFGNETVCNLVTWSHAYKQSRQGEWVKMANDRAHFKRRIGNIAKVLEPVLRIMCDKISKE